MARKTPTPPKKRGRGRQTKLTPELRRKFCDALRMGATRKAACGVCRIGTSTFHRWMNAGELAESGIQRDFWEAVVEAEGSGETKYASVVHRICMGLPASPDAEDVPKAADSLRAALGMLTKRYGWVDRTEVSGPEGSPVQIQAIDATAPSVEAGRAHIAALRARMAKARK